MKIHRVEAELFHSERRTDGRTDRQTDRQTLKVGSCKFSNSPGNAETYFIHEKRVVLVTKRVY